MSKINKYERFVGRLLWRVVAVGGLFACLLGAAMAGATQTPLPPDSDPFYRAPPGLAATRPGQLLRSRAIDLDLGEPLRRAWQVLYRSNDAAKQPIAAAVTILLPSHAFQGGSARPLLSYQIAEDSLATSCAPSYTLRTLDTGAAVTRLESGLITTALSQGWVVAVPDFEGPRSEYLVGALEAHTVLDGVRAALGFAPAGLSAGSQVGLWGYSGGAHATGWASELQPAYAPELNLRGVAEGGVPADLPTTIQNLDGSSSVGYVFGVLQAYSRAYPWANIPALLNTQGVALFATQADACNGQIVSSASFHHISDYTVVSPLQDPATRQILLDNGLGRATPAAPLYIYQSAVDELIPVATVNTLRQTYCRDGAKVDYRLDYLEGGHNSVALLDAPSAVAYLQDRFLGRQPSSNCPP